MLFELVRNWPFSVGWLAQKYQKLYSLGGLLTCWILTVLLVRPFRFMNSWNFVVPTLPPCRETNCLRKQLICYSSKASIVLLSFIRSNPKLCFTVHGKQTFIGIQWRNQQKIRILRGFRDLALSKWTDQIKHFRNCFTVVYSPAYYRSLDKIGRQVFP